MAGKYSAKSSKAPIIIIISIIILIIAVGVVVFFMNTGNTSIPTTDTQPTTAYEQQSDVETQADENIATEETTVPITEEQGETLAVKEEIDVLVPTQEGEEVSYFNATFSPSKAVDTVTGNECSLKEVFGSSYSGGVITFNNDGTFTDQIISSSGAYAVTGDSISATYINDKNMAITVNSWNGDTPSEFIINYGGYDVYFEG